mgnify:CR=1 FL=1
MSETAPTPKPNGAPVGNTNALKHGLRTKRLLPLGDLGKGYKLVERSLRAFRRSLEAAVIARHGEITLTLGAIICTAMRCEQSCQLSQRALRDAGKLTPSERLSFHRELRLASEQRDRNIRLLGLVASEDPLAALGVLDAVCEEPDPLACYDAVLDSMPEPAGEQSTEQKQEPTQ